MSSLLPSSAPKRPAGRIFIGLNVIRLISMVSLILVVSSTITNMVSDMKAVNAWIKAGSHSSGITTTTLDDEDWDCDTIEDSSVPNQVGGAVFSVLSRIIILMVCFVLFLSELDGPKLVRKFFELYVPSLGPAHSTGTLGFIQMFVAATVLAIYVPPFLQVSAWFLFVIGCFNFALGFFGAKVKVWRRILSFENLSTQKLSTLTPQTSMAYSAYQTASSNGEKISNSKTRFFPSSASDEKRPASKAYTDIEKDLSEHPRAGKIPFVSFGGQQPKPANGGNGVEGAGWGGFGRKAEQKAKLKGYLISKPTSAVNKP